MKRRRAKLKLRRQYGGVFKGVNRQRGRKKSQKGGLFGLIDFHIGRKNW